MLKHAHPGVFFLRADTVPAMQECFLRSSCVPQEPLPAGRTFSPLRWTLAVLLELIRRGENAELGFVEFATFVQTSNPLADVVTIVDKILDLRAQRCRSNAKKRFDTLWYAKMGIEYKGKKENFREYGDMNLRYLRATGMVRAWGHGITLMTEKRGLAERLAATQVFEIPVCDRYRELYDGPRLPTDDQEVAFGILTEIVSLVKSKGIEYSLDQSKLHSVSDINSERCHLENLLSNQAEENYAKDQKNQWREISDYIELVMRGGGSKRYDDEREICVPREEASAYLEWCLWRAFLAINTLHNKPYQLRRFKIDQDFLPVSTAPGNGPDLVAEYEHDVVAIEVTLSGGSRQEAMEGEPVRRHVANLIDAYPTKNVYGLFIANKVDTNTAETFRHGVWYGTNDTLMELNIVPFTLEQFKDYFTSMFISGRQSGAEITRLIIQCGNRRSQNDAPTWKKLIESDVKTVLSARQTISGQGDYVAAAEGMLHAAGVESTVTEYSLVAEDMERIE